MDRICEVVSIVKDKISYILNSHFEMQITAYGKKRYNSSSHTIKFIASKILLRKRNSCLNRHLHKQ